VLLARVVVVATWSTIMVLSSRQRQFVAKLWEQYDLVFVEVDIRGWYWKLMTAFSCLGALFGLYGAFVNGIQIFKTITWWFQSYQDDEEWVRVCSTLHLADAYLFFRLWTHTIVQIIIVKRENMVGRISMSLG
jgi:hypothetical protein